MYITSQIVLQVHDVRPRFVLVIISLRKRLTEPKTWQPKVRGKQRRMF